MILPDKIYNILKWFVTIFLPALTTFLGVVLKCFNVQCTDVILTILVAFTTFLGTLIGISSHNYNKAV